MQNTFTIVPLAQIHVSKPLVLMSHNKVIHSGQCAVKKRRYFSLPTCRRGSPSQRPTLRVGALSLEPSMSLAGLSVWFMASVTTPPSHALQFVLGSDTRHGKTAMPVPVVQRHGQKTIVSLARTTLMCLLRCKSLPNRVYHVRVSRCEVLMLASVLRTLSKLWLLMPIFEGRKSCCL